jgi:hypothetical protein
MKGRKHERKAREFVEKQNIISFQISNFPPFVIEFFAFPASLRNNCSGLEQPGLQQGEKE